MQPRRHRVTEKEHLNTKGTKYTKERAYFFSSLVSLVLEISSCTPHFALAKSYSLLSINNQQSAI